MSPESPSFCILVWQCMQCKPAASCRSSRALCLLDCKCKTSQPVDCLSACIHWYKQCHLRGIVLLCRLLRRQLMRRSASHSHLCEKDSQRSCFLGEHAEQPLVKWNLQLMLVFTRLTAINGRLLAFLDGSLSFLIRYMCCCHSWCV